MSERDYEFSLELVANIAAKLLKGNDYATAAQRALDLLETCNLARRERAKSNAEWIAEQRKEIKENQENRQKENEGKIPWAKAVRQITGKSTEEKAMTAFRPFFSKYYSTILEAEHSAFDAQTVNRVCDAFIQKRKNEEMTVTEMKNLRIEYQKWPRRAPRKKN